jgi:class 3 adenylate cyclase/TolB-like protein
MKSQTRQLVAIVFTDIVGYTAMMGKDEKRAFDLLDKNREIQKPIIEAFNGQLIKEMGDGILATFSTVSQAVHASVQILRASVANEFQLHIGIHTAEVVFENGDVFGDGVNIASRLQTLAPASGIYISESVNNNISNRKEFKTRFVKTEYLKNVKDAVQIYEVVLDSDSEAEIGATAHAASAGHPGSRKGGGLSSMPGFNTDVFISYRQNDNKSPSGSRADGWVTEFVHNLSLELEATIKGKVAIYFDQNPHDGLLESHDVDESLANRLKSLIFIPIVSQTYCDPACYAWHNEFLQFTRLADADPIGLSVKLPSGNVASRILPVRIHEVDEGDIQLLEGELRTKFRPIDLIFKAPGVNRPLRAREDDPLKNSNKIIYRDQINKVANAIKEIITALKTVEAQQTLPEKTKVGSSPSLSLPNTQRTTPSIRSITVKPFVATEPTEEFLAEGLSEEILTSVAQVKSYKVTHPSIAAMSLEGTLKSGKNSITAGAQLIENSGKKVLWSNTYECGRAELFTLHARMISDFTGKLGIVLKESEQKAIRKVANANPAAQELNWKGRYLWRKRGNDLIKSLDCFQQALQIDPTFAQALSGTAMALVLMGYYNLIPFEDAMRRAKEAAFRALDLDASLHEAYHSLAFISLCYEWNWPEAEHNFIKVFAINPQGPSALKRYQLCLGQIKYDFEEAEAEPLGGVPYFLHAYALLHQGKPEEALLSAKQAVDRDANSFMAKRALGLSYLSLGHEKDALKALKEATQLSNRHPWMLFDLMGAYATAANNEEAQAIMDEALAGANAMPARINDFFFRQG